MAKTHRDLVRREILDVKRSAGQSISKSVPPAASSSVAVLSSSVSPAPPTSVASAPFSVHAPPSHSITVPPGSDPRGFKFGEIELNVARRGTEGRVCTCEVASLKGDEYSEIGDDVMDPQHVDFQLWLHQTDLSLRICLISFSHNLYEHF